VATSGDLQRLRELLTALAREDLLHAQRTKPMRTELAALEARILGPRAAARRDSTRASNRDEKHGPDAYDVIMQQDPFGLDGPTAWTELRQPDPLARLKLPHALREVLKALATLGGEAKLGDIVEQLGVGPNPTGVRLARVVDLGLVERVGRGVYRLAEKFPAELPQKRGGRTVRR
jgi:hypothetical protein